MTVTTPGQIRQARAYLQNQNITASQVSPKLFAAASVETGKSFRDLLNFISRLLSGGQGQGPSPATTQGVDQLDPINAIGKTPIEYANAPGVEQ